MSYMWLGARRTVQSCTDCRQADMLLQGARRMLQGCTYCKSWKTEEDIGVLAKRELWQVRTQRVHLPKLPSLLKVEHPVQPYSLLETPQGCNSGTAWPT